MIKVLFYGIARIKFKIKEKNYDAKSVKELLEKIGNDFNLSYKEMQNFLIYVNDVNITELKLFKTELKDGDVVMILSPSSGG